MCEFLSVYRIWSQYLSNVSYIDLSAGTSR